MESFRLSSKIHENDREYLIRTTNQNDDSSVLTTVFVNGEPAESLLLPHPPDSNNEEILTFLKMTHEEKKTEIETLLESYSKLQDSQDPQLIFHIGTAFFYKGFFDEAKHLFQLVIELLPEHHQAFNYLGMTQFSLGDYPGAIKSNSTAVGLKSNYPDYLNNLAEAFLGNNEADAAIKFLSKALELNLYYADAYFNLAIAYLTTLLNNSNQASNEKMLDLIKDYLHRSSIIYAGYKTHLLDEAVKYLDDGQVQQALSVLYKIRMNKKELQSKEFAAFYMKFVMHPELITEKVVTERIKYLQQEIDKNPTYVDLRLELMESFFEQTNINWKNGMLQLAKAIEMNPNIEQKFGSLAKIKELQELFAQLLKNLKEKR